MIEEKKLTEKEVLQIVKEWYTNGMYADILQNEYGEDLEEIIEKELIQYEIQVDGNKN